MHNFRCFTTEALGNQVEPVLDRNGNFWNEHKPVQLIV